MQSSVLVSGSLHESGALRGFLMKTGKGGERSVFLLCFLTWFIKRSLRDIKVKSL